MFFGSKNNQNFFGVDFGTRSIKAVEVKVKKGTPYLENYGYVLLDNAKEALDSFDGDYSVLLQEALKALIAKMKPKTDRVNVAIPAFNGLVMTVDFPYMTEEELAKAIQFESRKYIPTSLDDVNVSWEIIDQDKTKKDQTMKVLLVAAPKSEVRYYDQLFEGTGMTVDALELETFALARLLVGESKERMLLIDIGAKTTNLVLVDEGVVRVNRNVDVGGIDLTQTISDQMNISTSRAREMKESGKDFFKGPMPTTFPSLGYITAEIERIMQSQKADVLDGFILSGGSAQMKGLKEYFEKELQAKGAIADPMTAITSTQKNLSDEAIVLGTSFNVAAGLALQGVDSKNDA